MTVAGPLAPTSLSPLPSPGTSRQPSNDNLELQQFFKSEPEINDATLEKAAQKWPWATKITLETTSSNQITLQPDFLKKLSCLFINICDLQIKNYFQRHFTYNIDNTSLLACSNLAQLKTLVLGCTNLDKNSFTTLFQTCTELRHVEIHSDQLTSDHLSQALALKHLTTLMISGRNKINDEGLRILSQQGSKLRELGIEIYHDKKQAPFSLKAAQAFVATLPQLRSLLFQGTDELDDQFVLTLAAHHSSLTFLSLQPQPLISNETLDQLQKGCPQLTHLVLGDIVSSEKGK